MDGRNTDAVLKKSCANNGESVLTAREYEILALMANGLSTKHIADKLFVSKDTVESHRKNILRKLDAANMVEGMAIAFRNKWIE